MEFKEFGICCEECQLYSGCETKWCRGERGEKDICCKSCNYYDDCFIEHVKRRVRLKKGWI